MRKEDALAAKTKLASQYIGFEGYLESLLPATPTGEGGLPSATANLSLFESTPRNINKFRVAGVHLSSALVLGALEPLSSPHIIYKDYNARFSQITQFLRV